METECEKELPLPKKIDVYRASLGQIIWYSVEIMKMRTTAGIMKMRTTVEIMKMRTTAYEGVVGNIKLVLGKSLRLNLKCRPSICL